MYSALNQMDHVTAVVLAGGLGTRLHAVIADRPKVIAQVNGKPFLSFLFDQLERSGIRQVILCTGHLSKQIEDVYGNSYGPINIVYSRESQPLGTAGAIRNATRLFDSDHVLIMNGDSYCEADLIEFWKWHCQKDAEATIVLAQVPDIRRFGRVLIGVDNEIENFEEKGSFHNEGGWINSGIYAVKRDLIMTIPPDRRISLEKEIFPKWIGRSFFGYKNKGRFLDIGTPEDYAKAEDFFSLFR